MNDGWLAARFPESGERRGNDRRVFSYTEFFPERRFCFDRRSVLPLHLVALEDEEREALLEIRSGVS